MTKKAGNGSNSKNNSNNEKHKKNLGGRPTKYNAFFTPKVAFLAGKLGYTDFKIAEVLEINEETLNSWKKRHPKFSNSLQKGKGSVNDQVENSLIRRALGCYVPETKVLRDGTKIEIQKHYPPEPRAARSLLEVRNPKRWRNKTDVTANINITIDKDDLDV